MSPAKVTSPAATAAIAKAAAASSATTTPASASLAPEHVVIAAQNVFVVPAHITDDVAAVLDPLGNATHTALRFDVVGEDVLITGAGPIGVLAAAIVRHIGARHVVVTDVNPYRLAMAAAHGATRVVDVAHQQLGPVMIELGMTEGFDVGLEMSGAESAR